MKYGKKWRCPNIWGKHDITTIWGSNMVFHALTFARSRGRCWKPRPEVTIFNTSLGTWPILMHWKTMFDRYCIKTENICYISSYFLHFFVSPFHRYLANAISMDYARTRAVQYISRNGSKSGPGTSILKVAYPCINSAWIALLIQACNNGVSSTAN